MALIGFEELDAKIKLLVKELLRLQKQNKKYVLTLEEEREQKTALEAELQDCHNQLGKVNQLLDYIKQLEDEKATLQTKIGDIMGDLDKLEFL